MLLLALTVMHCATAATANSATHPRCSPPWMQLPYCSKQQPAWSLYQNYFGGRSGMKGLWKQLCIRCVKRTIAQRSQLWMEFQPQRSSGMSWLGLGPACSLAAARAAPACVGGACLKPLRRRLPALQEKVVHNGWDLKHDRIIHLCGGIRAAGQGASMRLRRPGVENPCGPAGHASTACILKRCTDTHTVYTRTSHRSAQASTACFADVCAPGAQRPGPCCPPARAATCGRPPATSACPAVHSAHTRRRCARGRPSSPPAPRFRPPMRSDLQPNTRMHACIQHWPQAVLHAGFMHWCTGRRQPHLLRARRAPP